MRILPLLFSLCCSQLLAQTAECRGAQCLIAVKTARGTRCGASDSMEMDVRNASSSLYLLGYVIFLTPSGTQNEATGLLAPGGKANVYVCHALGVPTFAANTNIDKTVLRYPETKVRDPSGLVVRECDTDPDGRVRLCKDENSECQDKVTARCEGLKTCLEPGFAACENTQTQCLARIRRCADGQICAAGACVPIPR
jgi:hypothetical protein